MLQVVLDKGENGAEEGKTELEELKLLLPDIAEKVEDAKESQRTAGSASAAIQQTLVRLPVGYWLGSVLIVKRGGSCPRNAPFNLKCVLMTVTWYSSSSKYLLIKEEVQST